MSTSYLTENVELEGKIADIEELGLNLYQKDNLFKTSVLESKKPFTCTWEYKNSNVTKRVVSKKIDGVYVVAFPFASVNPSDDRHFKVKGVRNGRLKEV